VEGRRTLGEGGGMGGGAGPGSRVCKAWRIILHLTVQSPLSLTSAS
jgi:hypothetical protein